jgi:hypothetical protein
MSNYGNAEFAEYHQSDKTHSHRGFSRDELYHLVYISGSEIRTYIQSGQIDAGYGAALWISKIPKKTIYLFLTHLNLTFSATDRV